MREISDYYIKGASSTILALTALIKGVAAGFFIYLICSFFLPVIAAAGGGKLEAQAILNSVFPDSNILGLNLENAGLTLSLFVLIGAFILAISGLILIVIDAISLILLRFARVGASAVKAVHIIHMIIAIFHLILFLYTVVMTIIDIAKLGSAAASGVSLVLIIPAVIYLVILLLQLCYHKDIARAMSTVKYDLVTGRRGWLKRTHLSGISFIFGIFSAILTLVLLIAALVSGQAATTVMLVSVLAMFIVTLQYFCICRCNRNLKRSRLIRSGRKDSYDDDYGPDDDYAYRDRYER